MECSYIEEVVMIEVAVVRSPGMRQRSMSFLAMPVVGSAIYIKGDRCGLGYDATAYVRHLVKEIRFAEGDFTPYIVVVEDQAIPEDVMFLEWDLSPWILSPFPADAPVPPR